MGQMHLREKRINNLKICIKTFHGERGFNDGALKQEIFFILNALCHYPLQRPARPVLTSIATNKYYACVNA